MQRSVVAPCIALVRTYFLKLGTRSINTCLDKSHHCANRRFNFLDLLCICWVWRDLALYANRVTSKLDFTFVFLKKVRALLNLALPLGFTHICPLDGTLHPSLATITRGVKLGSREL